MQRDVGVNLVGNNTVFDDAQAKSAEAARLVETQILQTSKAVQRAAVQVVTATTEEGKARAEQRLKIEQVNAALGENIKAQQAAARESVAASQQQVLAAQRVAAAQRESVLAATRGVGGGTAAALAATGTAATSTAEKINKAGAISALALVGIGVESVKMAADFQQETSVLVTAAGEIPKNLGMVRDGIKSIATETGTSLAGLTDGMYQVEKAGIRGGDGLKVLRAAAQGAKEENADLGTVTNAMTSIMSAYHLGADQSVGVMNALKTAAGGSKTTMQEFAASLSNVLPIASNAGITFDQVGGAIAAMTRSGTSGQQATDNLANTIRNLQAPGKLASNTMQQFGISVSDVSTHLGSRGLGGTLEYLVDTLGNKMGPQGLVMIDTFKKSASAGQDLQTMLQSMSPAAKGLADELLNNTVTVKEYRKEAGKLSPDQAAQARQFATLALQAKGFSDALKSGQPQAQTMAKLLKDMLGGATGLQTALQLTGQNQGYLKEMTDKTNASLHDGAKNVEGWDTTSKNLSTTMAKLHQDISVLAVNIGTALIPAVTSFVSFLADHQGVLKATAIAIGTGLVGATVAWTISLQANPIILFAEAVAALSVAVYEAWHNSETFRDVVKAAFVIVGGTVGYIVYGIVQSIKLMSDVFLESIGAMLHAAAVAAGNLDFGTGLASGIKEADRSFRSFKDSFNDTLSAVASNAAGWGSAIGSAIYNNALPGLSALQQDLANLGNMDATVANGTLGFNPGGAKVDAAISSGRLNAATGAITPLPGPITVIPNPTPPGSTPPGGGSPRGGGGAPKTPLQIAQEATAMNTALTEARVNLADPINALKAKLSEDKFAVAALAAAHLKGTVDFVTAQNTLRQAQYDLSKATTDNAVALKVAKQRAGVNPADPMSALSETLRENKDTLARAKKGTAAYFDAVTALAKSSYDLATAQKAAADKAKTDALDLKNSILGSQINYADPMSAVTTAVLQAQNTLNADTPGTAQYFKDLQSLHQAQDSLTQATNKTTNAMTNLGSTYLPSYIANRAAANGDSFYSPGRGGSSSQPVTLVVQLDGKVIAQSTVDALNPSLRRNGMSLLPTP